MKAHAKLNLHLQVLNRRSDNFHNLLSIMAEIELHDLLKLESFEIRRNGEVADVEIVPNGGDYSSLLRDIPSEQNLVSVAVKKYLNEVNCGAYSKFSIKKNIPSGAGLGGGSSDAASALNLVRGALNLEKDDRLLSSASASGSDVPFFLMGGIAFAEGRGEKLSMIDRKIGFPVLLVNNGIHVNTGAAYSALGRGNQSRFSTPDILSMKSELESVLADISLWKRYFINDFEKPVFDMYPELRCLKDRVYDLGADFALMSGSGSTVYGVYKSSGAAESALRQLQKDGNIVFFTKMAC